MRRWAADDTGIGFTYCLTLTETLSADFAMKFQDRLSNTGIMKNVMHINQARIILDPGDFLKNVTFQIN